ncbi:T9SS type A sorting domain-containing protein [Spirosoma sp. SC4-14]|uniref:T9SS type A sorting domain-containing protein n=1 Tax=Spirosoma sp. SC4-14 TaxID=3128900 RepID=UPI0030CF2069
MKSLTTTIVGVISLCLFTNFVWGQSNFKIQIYAGQEYNDGALLQVPCAYSSNYFDVYARYYNGLAYVNFANVSVSNVISKPSGYTLVNVAGDLSYLRVYYSYPQNGTLSFTAIDGSVSHTFSYNCVSTPNISVWSIPTSLGNNQSGTAQVQVIDQPGSAAVATTYYPLYYTAVNWQATGGLRVNGGTTYTTGNTGTYNSAPINTTSYGGQLLVSATNACGTSGYITPYPAIGTPYIVSTTFNGSPGSSGTVSWVATLSLLTNGTASGANWVITNGTGSISPSGTSCNAYPSSFLRVVGTATNSNGSGQDATFYIWLSGYSPYRAAYPNPTQSTLTLDFDDALMAQELIQEIALYNQKGNVVKQFDATKAADYFKQTKSVHFDVHELPHDTYFLHVKMGDKLFESQIIVQ